MSSEFCSKPISQLRSPHQSGKAIIKHDSVFISNEEITDNSIIMITENGDKDSNAKSFYVTLQPLGGFFIRSDKPVSSPKSISWFIVRY